MKFFQKHKNYWQDKSFLKNVAVGLFMLAISLIINSYAQAYAASHISNSVTDIVLDSIPVVDVHLIYSEGALLFLGILLAVLFYEPKYIPFVLKSMALLIITRSLFMVMTHLAPPADEIFINPNDYIQRLSQGDDLFFSGHTAFPFLVALTFWKNKYLKYVFLIFTIIGGAAVLLGHLHYSIDVFAALFITFSIFHISRNLFIKDYQRSQSL